MTPAQRVKRILDEVGGVAAQYGITSWERSFLDSVGREHGMLTEKQEAVLKKIEAKVFEEEE